MTPPRTRSSNKDTHPGTRDAPGLKPRCTAKEIKQAKTKLQQKKAAADKEQERKEKILAAYENAQRQALAIKQPSMAPMANPAKPEAKKFTIQSVKLTVRPPAGTPPAKPVTTVNTLRPLEGEVETGEPVVTMDAAHSATSNDVKASEHAIDPEAALDEGIADDSPTQRLGWGWGSHSGENPEMVKGDAGDEGHASEGLPVLSDPPTPNDDNLMDIDDSELDDMMQMPTDWHDSEDDVRHRELLKKTHLGLKRGHAESSPPAASTMFSCYDA
jgi:hypothetical protein